ncbi:MULTISPECIES: hypothetical protein [Flavobacteriaceae]|uniref:Uncharacterized protein n=2 Tax=Flavobacteriaceae TaxID=49546 RepID=A0A4Y8APE6_9FLAO|nr:MULTISPECIES: hypothetical protein [Flavobacteriaceae]TEW72476.1 hypothetical protein E2488_13560 [Gramella jeungdoensis]GGK55446.1 hypothetical protein GCM10007963_24710 [Lutibacter litoralis]
MPLFYSHQPDEEVTINQQFIELDNWIEHFEFIAKELNYLIKLIHILQFKNNFNLELMNKKEENNYLLSLFYDFRNKSENSLECMDIPYDMYYVNQQELYREQYLIFIRGYRKFKTEILSKL